MGVMVCVCCVNEREGGREEKGGKQIKNREGGRNRERGREEREEGKRKRGLTNTGQRERIREEGNGEANKIGRK